jgi:mannose-6-phosphate isomerase-like protein (cupin superfamily)
MAQRLSVHESEIERETYPDRWSKDLIGGDAVPAGSGFSLGIAEYTQPEFGAVQQHDDLEELYVVSGDGQIRVGDEFYTATPGVTLRVGPGVKHCTRRTADAPVFLVYSHGKPGPDATVTQTSMGVSETASREFVDRKSHDDHEALFVISGEGQVQVGDDVIDVKPGTAVYVPPGAIHARRCSSDEPLQTLFAHGAV